MQLRRLVAAIPLAFILVGAAACNGAPQPVKDAGYEVARANLKTMLEGLSLTGVTVAIETETDETKAKAPAAKPSTNSKPAPRSSSSTAPQGKKTTSTSAQTTTKVTSYKLLSAEFDIPGLRCRGNVEQKLEPELGVPTFDEVYLPDGTQVEVPENFRTGVTLDQMFNYAFRTYPECRQTGVTAPPTPSASAPAGAPSATS